MLLLILVSSPEKQFLAIHVTDTNGVFLIINYAYNKKRLLRSFLTIYFIIVTITRLYILLYFYFSNNIIWCSVLFFIKTMFNQYIFSKIESIFTNTSNNIIIIWNCYVFKLKTKLFI